MSLPEPRNSGANDGGDADLAGRAADFRQDHPEYFAILMRHRKLFESIRVARIDELDPGQNYLRLSVPEYSGHGLDHFDNLLREGVIDGQN
jgi:hypothetical protein